MGGVCVNVRVHLLSMWMLRKRRLRGSGWGWVRVGGVCVNVRVHLLSMCMLRKGRLRGWGWGWGRGGSVLTFVRTCFRCACYAKDVFGVGVGVGGVAVRLGWFCYLYVLMNMFIYLLHVLALRYL